MITVAIVGCGSRGQMEYTKDFLTMPDRVKIVACADINPEKLVGMRKKTGLTEAQCYASAEELLQQPKLADVLVVATPDELHYSHAKAGLNLGYHLLLEKPITPFADQCLELAKLAEEKQRHVVVCHVLRYTVFYQKIKEVIDSGVLGDIASIQALEKVAHWHQAHSFVRGNWRREDNSSCMILAKCCHDMDILLWLTGKKCERVSSFGSLMHFKPENAPEGAPARCTDGCPAADTCPYNAVRWYGDRLRAGKFGWPIDVVCNEPTMEELMHQLRTGPYGRCVYHCDNDVVDHQVVNMELEGGLTVNFTMSAFTMYGGRTIRVMGTMGELSGDMDKNIIRVSPYVGKEEIINVKALTNDFSGHGGGDAIMVREFVDLLEGAAMSTTLTSIDRSVESHLVCLAAEKSRVNHGAVVEL